MPLMASAASSRVWLLSMGKWLLAEKRLPPFHSFKLKQAPGSGVQGKGQTY